MKQSFVNNTLKCLNNCRDFDISSISTVNVLKFQTLFSFFVIRAGIHKLLVRIINRVDLDQTA